MKKTVSGILWILIATVVMVTVNADEEASTKGITQEQAIAIANLTKQSQVFLEMYGNYISISVKEYCLERDKKCAEQAGYCSSMHCIEACNCTKYGWEVHYLINTSLLTQQMGVRNAYVPHGVSIRMDKQGNIVSKYPDIKYLEDENYCRIDYNCRSLKIDGFCTEDAYNLWHILFYKIKLEETTALLANIDECKTKCANHICVAKSETEPPRYTFRDMADSIFEMVGVVMNQFENIVFIETTVMENGERKTYKQNLTMPDIVPVTPERDILPQPPDISIKVCEDETRIDGFLGIASDDNRVQKLLAGKEYKVDAAHEIFDRENDGHEVVLILKVEQGSYTIKIDMNCKKVRTIEEFG
ncbi:MAG: hypothetical protein A7316_02420 [Candidatus Altiarchaeales archaeon WOR_SM1_86-2]|nr:MAG: hypothetical protein A7316_02420 [Candidatus Altiarchaeales archaeon WOR_SM1_86-2]